jgi:hypothetical protein
MSLVTATLTECLYEDKMAYAFTLLNMIHMTNPYTTEQLVTHDGRNTWSSLTQQTLGVAPMSSVPRSPYAPFEMKHPVLFPL